LHGRIIPDRARAEQGIKAASAETFARPNEICIDDGTRSQTAGAFQVEEIGAIDVRNRAEPVSVYKVIGTR
jgi:class 3 adenylate cyclase